MTDAKKLASWIRRGVKRFGGEIKQMSANIFGYANPNHTKEDTPNCCCAVGMAILGKPRKKMTLRQAYEEYIKANRDSSDYLGITESLWWTMANNNDTGKSFEQVAEVLEGADN
jgi:hypothetical protein